MKRILFISQYLNRAGTESFMMNIFRNLDHNRFRVDFLLFSWKETEYSKEVEAAGCKVWRVPCRRESPTGWYTSLYRFFKEHAKDYIAIHYNGNGLTAIAPIVFAFLFKIPIRIVHAHNSSASGFHNKFLHILHRSFVRKITTHHFACSTAAAKWFFGNSPALIVRNGIDVKKFAFNEQKRKAIRKNLNIDENTYIIGHVGRFEKEKNHSFILETFSEFIKIKPDSRLMLVGIGSLSDIIKQKAICLGIAEKVMFLGERSDVDNLLQAMDLFFMPSTFEGQPFVLIEAQCSGLPCLISDIINKDVCLTKDVQQMSLSIQHSEWAKEILNILLTHNRKDESNAIQLKGYSIEDTIKMLEDIYTEKK